LVAYSNSKIGFRSFRFVGEAATLIPHSTPTKDAISGQFKSDKGADGFAVLRSIIDTTIKSGQNVLNALSLIAKLSTE
jgi:hypothetical protein